MEVYMEGDITVHFSKAAGQEESLKRLQRSLKVF